MWFVNDYGDTAYRWQRVGWDSDCRQSGRHERAERTELLRLGRWWLAYTKPRNEKVLAADLENMGVDYFLPLARVRRRHCGRPVELQVPLFPSYLFVWGQAEERYAALRTNRVVNIITVTDQRELSAELQNVYQATVSDVPVDLYPGLKEGRRVRIIGGSLQGLEGVVLRRRQTCRVYVAVHVLGQSAQVDIDSALVEALD